VFYNSAKAIGANDVPDEPYNYPDNRRQHFEIPTSLRPDEEKKSQSKKVIFIGRPVLA
jgi:hypothetical protein